MTRFILVASLLAALALPVVVGNTYYVNIATQILVAAIFASSLNILVGHGGLTSLGHAVFFGLAGYMIAWLTVRSGFGFWPAALLSIVGTMLAAVLLGAIALRTTGIAFVMITLAIGQTIWGVAFRWASVTGGDNGLPGVPRPALPFISMEDPTSFYLVTAAVFLACLGSIALLVRSGLGRSLEGTRDEPRRMAMLGFNVRMIRLAAFVISGFWAAVAGAVFVAYQGYIHPQVLGLSNSAEVLLMVIAGGAGTLLGPVIGAFTVVVLKLVVSAYVTRWMLLLGVVFVLIVLFMPHGLVPGARKLLRGKQAQSGKGRASVG